MDDILKQFEVLKDDICCGVFKQKAAAAWYGSRAEKIQVSMVLPGGSGVDDWCDTLAQMLRSWPAGITTGKFQLNELLPATFLVYRKYLRQRTSGFQLIPSGTSFVIACIPFTQGCIATSSCKLPPMPVSPKVAMAQFSPSRSQCSATMKRSWIFLQYDYQ